MSIERSQFLSMGQLQEQYFPSSQKTTRKSVEMQTTSFEQIWQEKSRQASGVKFSKHAANRLLDRKIDLSDGQMERLNEGAKVAAKKGIKETLVMVDQLAFIVNIPNNTVVTAMDQAETKENVFTNIDGAVIM